MAAPQAVSSLMLKIFDVERIRSGPKCLATFRTVPAAGHVLRDVISVPPQDCVRKESVRVREAADAALRLDERENEWRNVILDVKSLIGGYGIRTNINKAESFWSMFATIFGQPVEDQPRGER